MDFDSTVISYLKEPNGDCINCETIYSPSQDKPEYWRIVDRKLSERQSDYKIIMADFNTSLNFTRETARYLTDPHQTSRN